MRAASTSLVLLALAAASLRVSAVAAATHVVHSFKGGSGGANSFSTLLRVGNLLYGTTWQGGGPGCGGSGCGTVFAFDPATGVSTTLYDFKGGTDGALPVTNLIEAGGLLYGTTTFGGRGCTNAELPGCGVVYSFNPVTGAEAVVYALGGGNDGEYVQAGVIASGGTLYGTTASGGGTGNGTAFAVDAKTGAERWVYAFQAGSDGAVPTSGLVIAGGQLYGTTLVGGGTGCSGFGCGTVFRIDPQSGAESLVTTFQGGNDAGEPGAALIYSDGLLYGTSSGGGGTGCQGYGCGTLFTVAPRTGAETVIYAFKGGTDGAQPYSSVLDMSGTLYGTTENGGVYGSGTVYALHLRTGTEKILYSFGARRHDARTPDASLVVFNDLLYGTTEYGGRFDDGTIYSVRK